MKKKKVLSFKKKISNNFPGGEINAVFSGGGIILEFGGNPENHLGLDETPATANVSLRPSVRSSEVCHIREVCKNGDSFSCRSWLVRLKGPLLYSLSRCKNVALSRDFHLILAPMWHSDQKSRLRQKEKSELNCSRSNDRRHKLWLNYFVFSCYCFVDHVVR